MIFIYGAPRSGTTWLWKMLSMHPNIVPYHRKGSSESGIYAYSTTPKQHLLDFQRQHPDKVILEKTPVHCFYYEQIRRDFPDHKAIVVHRSPYAIVNSMLHSDMEAFRGYDIEKAVYQLNHYRKALANIKGCEITYENLTMPELFRLLKKLNMPLSMVQLAKIYYSTKNKPIVEVKGAYRKGNPNSWQYELAGHQKQYIANHLI